ncbi:hypothetical protein ACWTU6_27360 [Mesorhizobium sp. BHbsci]
MSGNAQKIAENVLLLAIARVSMALSLPLIGFVAWLGGQYLDGKFDTQDQKIASQREATENQAKLTTARVETVEKAAQSAIDQAGKVNERLISVETKQAQDSASSDKFQAATLTRLDRVQDSIVGLSNAVSALTATMQAIAEQRNRSPPER